MSGTPSKRLPISVFIITKDEEDRIVNAIESVVGWVDEVIVVDSGSGDNTCELALASGADRVMYHPWAGYGQQKRFAEEQCANYWVINLDADEEISPELRDEIISLFDSPMTGSTAYAFRILNTFPFEQKPSRFADEKVPVRLYDLRHARFRDDPVHDSVVFNNPGEGRIRVLQGIVYHRSFRGLDHMMQKNLAYAEMQAQKMAARGKSPAILRLLLEPFFSFFKSYVLRRHFLYGAYGVSVAVCYMATRVYRLARARELTRKGINHD